MASPGVEVAQVVQVAAQAAQAAAQAVNAISDAAGRCYQHSMHMGKLRIDYICTFISRPEMLQSWINYLCYHRMITIWS